METEETTPANYFKAVLGEDNVVLLRLEDLVRAVQPKIDLLIRCNSPEGWNTEQRRRLPDGLRRTNATHILLNFAESQVNEESPFKHLLACGWLYQESHHLKYQDVLLVVVFTREPDRNLLSEFGFVATKLPGIYRSSLPLIKNQKVMVLSELSNAPYNALFKCFARNQKSRQEAYQTVLRYKRPYFTPSVRAVIAQIAALTEQEVDQYNEELHGALLASLSGPSRIVDQEPFADLSSIEILKEMEAYLQAQL